MAVVRQQPIPLFIQDLMKNGISRDRKKFCHFRFRHPEAAVIVRKFNGIAGTNRMYSTKDLFGEYKFYFFYLNTTSGKINAKIYATKKFLEANPNPNAWQKGAFMRILNTNGLAVRNIIDI